MPTNNIIKGLILGDEKTYISLFREYYVPLCAYSRRYVGRKDVAEEIVSDTFLKIWENRASIQINTSIKSYLFQAVYNNSLYYLRKLKNEAILEDYFSNTASENIAFSTLADETPEESLVMDDINTRIEEAVAQLPDQQQKAFRLKRFDGRKNAEVAKIMGISVKTVEMHLAKATLTLRKNLKDYLPSFLLFLLLK
ncbi:MAG TPA: RNA polymerase sigma-70 factor [Prolixibacteraceae bacterium]|nr:RNA polymerase sigma-70 factor [Prolixibacteraceae bacterium]